MNKKALPDNQSNFLLYTGNDGKVNVEVFLKDETIWLTQKAISELCGVQRPAITKHLKNIFGSGKLQEDSVSSILEHTASDGKKYKTKFYNLNAIIPVGYRVNSYQATQFCIWATKALKEYIIKGFVLDDERLKQGKRFGKDYFEELLERIKEIRASERRFYQKITDIYALAADYDKNAPITKEFFATVQNKMHWAITGKTWLFNFFWVDVSMTKKINHRGHGGHRELLFSLCPLCSLWFFQNPFQNITKSLGKPAAEIIYDSADATKLHHICLTNRKQAPDGKILKSGVSLAKNYLNEAHIKGEKYD